MDILNYSFIFYQEYPHPVNENILIHSKEENNESIIEMEQIDKEGSYNWFI